MVDRQLATRMYEEGYPLVEIGRRFSVSKQRVWQILKPLYLKLDTPERRPPNNFSPISRPEVLFIVDELERRKIKATPQGYNTLFNLLINEKKVSIRYLTNPSKKGIYSYYRFCNLSAKIELDFYILLVGQIPLSTVYVIPKERIKRTLYIPVSSMGKVNKKWNIYKEAWHLLK